MSLFDCDNLGDADLDFFLFVCIRYPRQATVKKKVPPRSPNKSPNVRDDFETAPPALLAWSSVGRLRGSPVRQTSIILEPVTSGGAGLSVDTSDASQVMCHAGYTKVPVLKIVEEFERVAPTDTGLKELYLLKHTGFTDTKSIPLNAVIPKSCLGFN
jgi:hypothetical protein